MAVKTEPLMGSGMIWNKDYTMRKETPANGYTMFSIIATIYGKP